MALCFLKSYSWVVNTGVPLNSPRQLKSWNPFCNYHLIFFYIYYSDNSLKQIFDWWEQGFHLEIAIPLARCCSVIAVFCHILNPMICILMKRMVLIKDCLIAAWAWPLYPVSTSPTDRWITLTRANTAGSVSCYDVTMSYLVSYGWGIQCHSLKHSSWYQVIHWYLAFANNLCLVGGGWWG